MNINNLSEEDPQIILERIENGEFNNFRNDEWVHVFSILLDKYEQINKINEARNMLIEIRIHSLGYNHIRNEFFPLSGTIEEFSQFVNDFFIQYSKSRARKTQNSVLKARYADIVWEFGSRAENEFAFISIDAYLKNINYFYKKKNFSYFLQSLSRAFYIAFKTDNEQKLKDCLDTHLSYLEELSSSNLIRWTYDLLNNILKYGIIIKEELDINKLLNYINQGKKFYKNRDILFFHRFKTLDDIFKVGINALK